MELKEGILSEKDRELHMLKDKLRDDNLLRLIEVTKQTSEATQASKLKHEEEMEKLRKKQEDYKEKIQRIQQTFTHVKVLDQSSEIPMKKFDASQLNEDDSDMRPTRLRQSQDEDSSALLLYSQDGVSVLMS